MDPRSRRSLLDTLLARIGARRFDPPPITPPVRNFQAISIYRGVEACPPAKRFSEHRFLAKDAPTLPLPGCTMPETCQCKYLKHKDRRSYQRRAQDFTSTSRIYVGPDRRTLRGRRSTDRPAP